MTYHKAVRTLIPSFTTTIALVSAPQLMAQDGYAQTAEKLCEQLEQQNVILRSIHDAPSAEQARLDYLVVAQGLQELKSEVDDEHQFFQFITNDVNLRRRVDILLIEQAKLLQAIEAAGSYENQALGLLLFGQESKTHQDEDS